MSVRDNRQAEAVGTVGIVLLLVAVLFAATLLLTWSNAPTVINEPGGGSTPIGDSQPGDATAA